MSEDENDSKVVEHHDIKTQLAGIAGNVLEWYDFSVYGYFSDIIGEVFFPPSDNPNGNLVESFAVFGLAFLVRPIGGAVFGLMGDNVGRKHALENSILLMALPTFALGFLPSYASVGWISTALLIICRILQGFSVGGQFMSSVVFSLEGHDETIWGMKVAWVFFATGLGACVGSLTSFILRETLNDDQLKSFGWRIPFFFGILGVIPGLYLKYRAKELPGPESNGSEGEKKVIEFKEIFVPENRSALGAAVLVPALTSGGYYVVLIWMAVYMETIVKVPQAFGLNTAVGILGLGLIFLGGYLADKFGPGGRVPLMLLSSLIFGIAAPFFINMIGEGDPATCFVLQLAMVVLLGTYSGSMNPWMVSNFPPRLRLTSVAFAYNVSVSVIGGFSPALATYLVAEYNNYAPGYIISVLAVISWIGIWVGRGAKDNQKPEFANKNLSGVI